MWYMKETWLHSLPAQQLTYSLQNIEIEFFEGREELLRELLEFCKVSFLPSGWMEVETHYDVKLGDKGLKWALDFHKRLWFWYRLNSTVERHSFPTGEAEDVFLAFDVNHIKEISPGASCKDVSSQRHSKSSNRGWTTRGTGAARETQACSQRMSGFKLVSCLTGSSWENYKKLIPERRASLDAQTPAFNSTRHKKLCFLPLIFSKVG